jgi:hypothetical protein
MLPPPGLTSTGRCHTPSGGYMARGGDPGLAVGGQFAHEVGIGGQDVRAGAQVRLGVRGDHHGAADGLEPGRLPPPGIQNTARVVAQEQQSVVKRHGERQFEETFDHGRAEETRAAPRSEDTVHVAVRHARIVGEERPQRLPQRRRHQTGRRAKALHAEALDHRPAAVEPGCHRGRCEVGQAEVVPRAMAEDLVPVAAEVVEEVLEAAAAIGDDGPAARDARGRFDRADGLDRAQAAARVDVVREGDGVSRAVGPGRRRFAAQLAQDSLQRDVRRFDETRRLGFAFSPSSQESMEPQTPDARDCLIPARQPTDERSTSRQAGLRRQGAQDGVRVERKADRFTVARNGDEAPASHGEMRQRFAGQRRRRGLDGEEHGPVEPRRTERRAEVELGEAGQKLIGWCDFELAHWLTRTRSPSARGYEAQACRGPENEV